MNELFLPSMQSWYLLMMTLSVVWGACIGSFLNVCIYRIPLEQSIVKPRSHCPHCNKLIPWQLNIPIVSYLYLRGKCGFCGKRISPRYLIVESLVGVLFLLVFFAWRAPDGTAPLGLAAFSDAKLVPVYWLFVSGLVLGTFVDFDHMIIPDRVTLGGMAAGLALSLLVPSMHGETTMLRGLMWSAIGAASGWMILWGVAVLGKLAFRKDAMGFGDVKLMGAIGAFLGWRAVIFTLVVSSFFGALVGISLVLGRRREMQSQIPYGPYLALAALIWMLWGPTLWQAYVNLILPAP